MCEVRLEEVEIADERQRRRPRGKTQETVDEVGVEKAEKKKSDRGFEKHPLCGDSEAL